MKNTLAPITLVAMAFSRLKYRHSSLFSLAESVAFCSLGAQTWEILTIAVRTTNSWLDRSASRACERVLARHDHCRRALHAG
jgi:hypothetical protein